jgi:hypothetical protein
MGHLACCNLSLARLDWTGLSGLMVRSGVAATSLGHGAAAWPTVSSWRGAKPRPPWARWQRDEPVLGSHDSGHPPSEACHPCGQDDGGVGLLRQTRRGGISFTSCASPRWWSYASSQGREKGDIREEKRGKGAVLTRDGEINRRRRPASIPSCEARGRRAVSGKRMGRQLCSSRTCGRMALQGRGTDNTVLCGHGGRTLHGGSKRKESPSGGVRSQWQKGEGSDPLLLSQSHSDLWGVNSASVVKHSDLSGKLLFTMYSYSVHWIL